MKPFAKKFYKSTAWLKCRESYIVLVHGLCERCGAGGKIVHHKEYLTPDNIDDPTVSLNHEMLELLCHECHNFEHFGEKVTAKGLKFNEYGELVQS